MCVCVCRECSDVQLEILRVKQNLEESQSRERSAIRCDIIKRRRQLLSEKVCVWVCVCVCVYTSVCLFAHYIHG